MHLICPYCHSTNVVPDKENPGEGVCKDCGSYFVANDPRNMEDDYDGYDD